MRGIANRVTFNTLIEALGQVSQSFDLIYQFHNSYSDPPKVVVKINDGGLPFLSACAGYVFLTLLAIIDDAVFMLMLMILCFVGRTRDSCR